MVPQHLGDRERELDGLDAHEQTVECVHGGEPVEFDGGANPVYWIYGFKRGSVWPFVPSGKDQRDNATELELKAKLEHELPIEPDLTRWLALFDAPL